MTASPVPGPGLARQSHRATVFRSAELEAIHTLVARSESSTPNGATGQAALNRYLVGAAVGALGMTGVTAAVIAGLGGLVAYSAARARREWGEGEPPDGCAEEVEFASAEDDTRLSGWFFRSRRLGTAPAVILCHGAWTGRRECLPLAVRFWEAGYHVLTFDFRAHGSSEGRYISVGHHEVKDVLGAISYVKSQPGVDRARVALVGFSMGAVACIQAAARSPEVAAVVADSAYADFTDAVTYSFRRVGGLPPYPFAPIALQWGRWLVDADPALLRPLDHIAHISPRPVMIIHSEDDEVVPVRHAHQLFKTAEEPKELWITPGNHVGARDLLADEYFERVEGFLKAAQRPFTLAPHHQATLTRAA